MLGRSACATADTEPLSASSGAASWVRTPSRPPRTVPLLDDSSSCRAAPADAADEADDEREAGHGGPHPQREGPRCGAAGWPYGLAVRRAGRSRLLPVPGCGPYGPGPYGPVRRSPAAAAAVGLAGGVGGAGEHAGRAALGRRQGSVRSGCTGLRLGSARRATRPAAGSARRMLAAARQCCARRSRSNLLPDRHEALGQGRPGGRDAESRSGWTRTAQVGGRRGRFDAGTAGDTEGQHPDDADARRAAADRHQPAPRAVCPRSRTAPGPARCSRRGGRT